MIERRQLRRLQMRCAVSLWKPSDGTFTRTTTENVSCDGFFSLCGTPYSPGDELQATLELPAFERRGQFDDCLTLQCLVEVVRIRGQEFGLACRIKDYTVIANSS
jgi:hypothetical protein